ncbi:OmpA family protein [Hymenobacter cellulosivorans]|uniref:OmpA family protein n=1 Tax=Hymenobacter cellulosivorans TaxID=2932249 RepID=A0ABY4FJV1_9BACT|nr:OmpA family protein [Hymenobacter cellulosivorans]UOQ54851.1 OmpA family protein [Hymenobacter cellulosivorans]
MPSYIHCLRHALVFSLPVMALTACSPEPKADEASASITKTAVAPVATASAPAATAPTETAAPAAPAGFDPSQVPVANPKLGAFPYFSLLDGYVKMDEKTAPGNSAREMNKDVNFDQYEFFDGTKLIPVAGRLRTVIAMGKTASFFQVQKTYEQLIHDMGGVTVFEGSGEKMKELKLNYEDSRHRARYNMLPYEKMGVYMVRTPNQEIWVEAYKAYASDPENYWLTVVEKKALPMQASVLPAEQLKKELDANGHVALYINFDTDKASIKPESGPVVGEVVKLLQTNPTLRLTVEGHTDDAGTPAHNQQLSEQRAQAVVAALTAQQIAADRLKPAGFGQTKPLADNATEEGKAKNRRVELVRL